MEFNGFKVFETREAAEAFLETLVSAETIAAEKAAKKVAEAAYAAERESFQRCDTDGFVSQWCHTLTGQQNDLAASVKRTGGAAIFSGLVEIATGALVATKTYEFFNKFAGFGFVMKYRAVTSEGVKWVPVGQKPVTYAKKGFRPVYVVASATVRTSHTSAFQSDRPVPMGFSGLGSIYAETFIDYARSGLKV